MAKARDEKKPGPDDEVRIVLISRREDRARLKAYCARTGEDMEEIGTKWILERLAAEEKRLSK